MQNTVKKSKRIFYLDALRALAIITVIAFHVYLRIGKGVSVTYGPIPPFSWFLTDFICNPLRCGVDIFLMLSGALSLGRDWNIKPFLSRRIPRIVGPFAFWLIVLCSIVIIVSYLHPGLPYGTIKSFDIKSIFEFFCACAMGDNGWFVPYWFFWMILGTYLIMPIFNRWARYSSFEEVEYFLVLWLITCLFDETLGIDFPIKLKYFAGPIGFVVLGYYLRHTKRKVFNDINYAFIIAFIGAFLLMLFSYLYSDTNAFYVFPRYSILNAIEVAGIYLIFKNFDQLNINIEFFSNPDGLFKRFIFEIAKYSFGIYLIHQIIMNFLIIFIPYQGPYSLQVILLIIATLLISMGILAALNRVPYINQVIGAK